MCMNSLQCTGVLRDLHHTKKSTLGFYKPSKFSSTVVRGAEVRIYVLGRKKSHGSWLHTCKYNIRINKCKYSLALKQAFFFSYLKPE